MVIITGLSAEPIIKKLYAGKNIIDAFTGLLLYFFAFDLIIRFFIQQLPTLSIKPYLTLPIKKSKLLHYPLIRSVPSIFNIIPVLLVLPFFIKTICTSQTALYSLAWIITILSFITINNYLNFWLKKYLSETPVLVFFVLIAAVSIFYLDISGIVSLSDYFSLIILYLANNAYLIMIPVLIAAFVYFQTYLLLRKNSYIESTQTGRTKTGNFMFLSRYGEVGNLIRVELKMILRNKRPKSVLYFSLLFLAYGFILYDVENLDNYFMLIIAGMILTSAFALNYGQFVFAWEGSYFDSYMANKLTSYNYIKSKYLLFAVSGIAGFIITLPYAIISYKIGLINSAMLLYNIGFSSILLLLFCTSNTTSIDLGKSQFLNYQGTGASQFLMVFPIMGFPLIIHIIFLIFGFPQYSIYALGITGLLGIIFNKYLLQLVVNQFLKRKYIMSAGFRKI